MRDRCEECNSELSYCGEMGSDGPSLDCEVCQLHTIVYLLREVLEDIAEGDPFRNLPYIAKRALERIK